VWISDLTGTPVVDEDGKRLGQVVELHIGPRHHRITEIMPGSAGWLDRLGLRPLADRNGRAARETIAWQAVMAVGKDRIVVRRSSLKGARRDR
jgi:sporulation protein YlmC with PRC-barrel domain